jgi:hypothetical protein
MNEHILTGNLLRELLHLGLQEATHEHWEDLAFLRRSKSPYMAVFSYMFEEPNEPLLRLRHPPRPESCTNNDGVKPPFCFKTTDHTIRWSKSQHHLQVSRLDSRKVDFKVSRQCHLPVRVTTGVGWLVVQPWAQRVLLHSQQQGATCRGRESAEHSLRIV